MIVIAADTVVAAQLVAELAAARVKAQSIDDPDTLRAAPRQPIVMITSWWATVPPGTESEKALAFDRSMRRAARDNGGDTFEVALADLQTRPDATMKHLILFASANLLAADPTPQLEEQR